MKKILKWSAIGFGVLILIGVVASVGKSGTTTSNTEGQSVSNSGSSDSPAKAEEQAAPTVVDATTLVAEYDKNKISAEGKYTGKTIETAGYIKNISDDITGKYYLSLNPSSEQYYFGTTITCYFADKSAKSEITTLENGQSVTVQGKMADMSLGIVVMNDCRLIK